MTDAPRGRPLASLLPDVDWHQRRAYRQTVLAFVALGVGIVPMMRLAVGLRSSPTAEDPWGPVDAAVIVAGMLLWAASFVLYSAARRTSAAPECATLRAPGRSAGRSTEVRGG